VCLYICVCDGLDELATRDDVHIYVACITMHDMLDCKSSHGVLSCT